MRLPYNRVLICDNIVFAARGGQLHSFTLGDGKRVSSWRHPDVKIGSNPETADANDARDTPELHETQTQDDSLPPAKRLKRVEDQDVSAVTQDENQPSSRVVSKLSKQKKSKNEHAHSRAQGHQVANVPDRPLITLLIGSPGGHIVAVSGHDKTIWVFEHDGQGNLRQLSQRSVFVMRRKLSRPRLKRFRTMPKRPSAIVVAPDGQMICADKFGDVYSLPLIEAPRSSFSLPNQASDNVLTKPSQPAANASTVHSKRNRVALDNQIKHFELERSEGDEVSQSKKPDFEHSLLMGHVSMLTSLALSEKDGRMFMLTADRDEHIRVSCYIPQTHVIHGFCLGHKEFVQCILVPPGMPDVLVSGGGDEKLFIWDWFAGTCLSETSILSLVQEIAPQATKVAVSGLYPVTLPSSSGSLIYILAICESIKAVFSWRLNQENALTCPSVVQLPAVPLHLSVSSLDSGPPLIVVAVDPNQTPEVKSLHILTLTLDDGRLAVDVAKSNFDECLDEGDAGLNDELRRLFYTTENMRKYKGEHEQAT